MAKDKNLVDYTVAHQDRSDFFHSSGYATVQNGDGIGAAGGGNHDSFAARQALEQNRQHIQNYKSSRIGNACYEGQQARTYSRTEDLSQMQSRRSSDSASNPMDVAMKRAKFSAGGVNADGSAIGSSRFSFGGGRKFGFGRGNSGAGSSAEIMSKAQPVLSSAKAPSIPTRRSGI